MLELLLLLVLLVLLVLALQLWNLRRNSLAREHVQLALLLEQKHRDMLTDLHQGFSQQSDRLVSANLAQQQLMQSVLQNGSEQLSHSVAQLNALVDQRLGQVMARVDERLDEGFKRSNDTFVSVMARLAAIDEAQKKIDGLAGNVVSLQQLLGDKRARGAFGEVQLEAIVRNMLPPGSYGFQQSLSNGTRVDCLLHLPPPTGSIAVDAKFPLDNYHRMQDGQLSLAEQQLARRQFKLDVKKHLEQISAKYLIANETADGAVMFVPAEAVFAEIHAHHLDLVEFGQRQRVWIVSPTTLMAILNTARAVLKDVEMRQQVHIIQDELVRLSADFRRFDERMKKLTDNIRRAHEEAGQVEISSRKISEHFARIEAVEMSSVEGRQ